MFVNIESVSEKKWVVLNKEYYYNKEGDKIEETEWHNIIAWGKTAEIIEKFVTKGQEVAVDGKITSRSYEDKEGIKRYITEIVCKELLMISKQ